MSVMPVGSVASARVLPARRSRPGVPQLVDGRGGGPLGRGWRKKCPVPEKLNARIGMKRSRTGGFQVVREIRCKRGLPPAQPPRPRRAPQMSALRRLRPSAAEIKLRPTRRDPGPSLQDNHLVANYLRELAISKDWYKTRRIKGLACARPTRRRQVTAPPSCDPQGGTHGQRRRSNVRIKFRKRRMSSLRGARIDKGRARERR